MTTTNSPSPPPLDLAAIEARADAATMWRPDECELREAEGEPWASQGATLGDTLVTLGDTYDGSAADWAFLAHARADVPALVALVRDLGARVEAAEAARARDLRAVVEAAGEAWDPRHDAADVVRRAIDAARREGAEAMREAVVAVLTERARWHEPVSRDESCEAIAAEVRALPLPEATR